jgi:hypothetical protein
MYFEDMPKLQHAPLISKHFQKVPAIEPLRKGSRSDWLIGTGLAITLMLIPRI